jgi:hypothetical protein
VEIKRSTFTHTTYTKHIHITINSLKFITLAPRHFKKMQYNATRTYSQAISLHYSAKSFTKKLHLHLSLIFYPVNMQVWAIYGFPLGSLGNLGQFFLWHLMLGRGLDQRWLASVWALCYGSGLGHVREPKYGISSTKFMWPRHDLSEISHIWQNYFGPEMGQSLK